MTSAILDGGPSPGAWPNDIAFGQQLGLAPFLIDHVLSYQLRAIALTNQQDLSWSTKLDALFRDCITLLCQGHMVASGLVDPATDKPIHINPHGWNHIKLRSLAAFQAGNLVVGRTEFYAIRVRPVRPIWFESAAFGLARGELLGRFVGAYSRTDHDEMEMCQLNLYREQIERICRGGLTARFYDQALGHSRDLTEVLQQESEFEIGLSSIVVGDGIPIPYGRIRVELPNPWPQTACRSDGPDSGAIAPRQQDGLIPRPPLPKQSDQRVGKAKKGRPPIVAPPEYDAEYERVRNDRKARDRKTVRQYMIGWAVGKVKNADGDPVSDGWHDDQLTRLGHKRIQ
jgi:hypothetical protein